LDISPFYPNFAAKKDKDNFHNKDNNE